MAKTYFITGIDTDVGKTVATGLMARYLKDLGKSVITHKPIQTGCVGVSEDILLHRKMMGISLLPEDKAGETCAYTFTKACSPHLAAKVDGREISLNKVAKSITAIRRSFDYVLVEGAGGLCAPMTREISSMRFVKEQGYPLVVVTSSRLGSLHHTVSLLELVAIHGLTIAAVLYNRFQEEDEEIGADSKEIVQEAMNEFGFTAPLIEFGDVAMKKEYDFSCLL